MGLINLSDTISGVSVGLLSIALRGYHRFDLFTDEMQFYGASIRTGTSQFYNAFKYGHSLDSREYWTFGYGFGGEINWPKAHTVNIEVTANHINEQRSFVEALNLVGRLDAIYNYTFAKRISISVGPSLNVLVSNWQDQDTKEFYTDIAPNIFFEDDYSDVLVQGWFGWRAGMGVRF